MLSEEKLSSAGKDASLEQEERIAKLFHASRTPRSGGGAWKKGDELSEDFLVECKTTVKPTSSYSVSKTVLDKANHERAEMRKPYYALAFTLGDPKEDYFVLDKRAMSAFIEERESIRNLIAALKKEIAELDRRFSAMFGSISQPSEKDKLLYQAHKQEKQIFIDSLERIL